MEDDADGGRSMNAARESDVDSKLVMGIDDDAEGTLRSVEFDMAEAGRDRLPSSGRFAVFIFRLFHSSASALPSPACW